MDSYDQTPSKINIKYLIIIFVLGIIYYLRSKIDRLFFFPNTYDKLFYQEEHHLIKFGSSLGISNVEKKTKNKGLLIAHGNAGSIYGRETMITLLASKFDQDIYCMEYPGFADCSGTLSITNCVKEVNIWIEELSRKGYDEISLYGESIGGGIIVQALKNLDQTSPILSNKIKKVYLQSTFASISSLLAKSMPLLSTIYNLTFRNDLDTMSVLKNRNITKNRFFYLIHSRGDTLIPYSEAEANLEALGINGKLIETTGDHNTTNIIKLKL